MSSKVKNIDHISPIGAENDNIKYIIYQLFSKYGSIPTLSCSSEFLWVVVVVSYYLV